MTKREFYSILLAVLALAILGVGIVMKNADWADSHSGAASALTGILTLLVLILTFVVMYRQTLVMEKQNSIMETQNQIMHLQTVLQRSAHTIELDRTLEHKLLFMDKWYHHWSRLTQVFVAPPSVSEKEIGEWLIEARKSDYSAELGNLEGYAGFVDKWVVHVGTYQQLVRTLNGATGGREQREAQEKRLREACDSWKEYSAAQNELLCSLKAQLYRRYQYPPETILAAKPGS
jgi:hypothetical protein